MTSPHGHSGSTDGSPSGRRGDRGSSDGNAGAWAAAAVVLGLGGLGFGVVAQVRVGDLESRVAQLEQRVPTTTVSVPQREVPEIPVTEPGGPVSTSPDGSSEGPADPVAAEAAVRQAYVTVYDGSKPIEERAASVDEQRGIAVALRAASSGEFSAQVANSRGSVERVTFTSPIAADVVYSVLVSGDALVSGARGGARIVDGVWKVTRATVCADLENVGAPCRG